MNKWPRKVKLVKQEDECGCVAACIAMVLGKTYQDVTKDFINDFKTKGINVELLISYLADHDLGVIHKKIAFYAHKDQFREELFKPFAPIHIVRIVWAADQEDGHVVVMTEDGKLLCPSGATEEDVRSSYTVLEVLGIYPYVLQRKNHKAPAQRKRPAKSRSKKA